MIKNLIVTIQIDTDKVLQAAGYENIEQLGDPENEARGVLNDAIRGEFGWLHSSGIYLKDIKDES